MLSNEKISELFKQTIFKGLEKVDIGEAGQRKGVYEAAHKSLNNIHSKNTNLTDSDKIHQTRLLSELIFEIEEKIVNLNDQDHSVTLNEDEVATLDETQFLTDDDLNNETSTGTLFGKLSDRFSSLKFFSQRTVVMMLVSIAAFVGLFAFYGVFFEANQTSRKLPLPYVLQADQTLLEFGKTTEKGVIRLADDTNDGIIYEVDIGNNEIPNRANFVIKGELAEQILAHDEPVLVTAHIQKISKEDIQLSFLFRGNGNNSRQVVKVVDQEINEFFLVSDVQKSEKKVSNVLIRLQISPASEKFEEKPVLLLKKIVFDKI